MKHDTSEGRPAFLKEAGERARRERISLKEALAADRERLHTTAYPGPDCLDPAEVERLVSAVATQPIWAEGRLSHVEECDDCATLLLACVPGDPAVRERAAQVVAPESAQENRAMESSHD